MKKYITIISGGSGNTAILESLYKLGYDSSDIRIIVNAYDSGKSTGICRKITNTLGVSDIRKNHWKVYKFEQEYVKHRAVKTNLQNFFTFRGDLNNPKEDVRNFLIDNKLDQLTIYSDYFFDIPESNDYEYKDFSIANIVYSGMFKLIGYDNTLEFMCKLLGIENCVVVNSYENIYISAKTETGNLILDEGEIVDYCNDKDKIVGIKINKSEYLYEHNIDLTNSCKEVLNNSRDIIISSGTFWSSIYPTFDISYFSLLYSLSNAKKYWFMNTTCDKDSYGVSSEDFYNHLKGCLESSSIRIILNKDADNDILKKEVDGKSILVSLGNDKGKYEVNKLTKFMENYCDF